MHGRVSSLNTNLGFKVPKYRGSWGILFACLAFRLGVGIPTFAVEFSPVQRDGEQLRLQWTPGAGLQQVHEAPTPSGPWQKLGTATETNVLSVIPSGNARFYRLSSAGSPPTGGEESMRATLAAVSEFVATVPRENRAAWTAQILNYLKNRPDINDAGESTDGVWAITEDGIPITLWNNRLPDPAGQDEAQGHAKPAGTETPGKTPARFAVAVGNGFTLASPRLSRLLRGNGYSTTTDGALLDSLKGVRNESVLFLNTHGGDTYYPKFGADGKLARNAQGKLQYFVEYGLWTGTKIDPAKTDVGYKHEEFLSELKAGRVTLALAPVSYTSGSGGFQTPNNEWHFCITAAWIRKYMSFPPENHASVWLGVCRSGSSAAAPLRSAFEAVGAEMVSGWTEDVNGNAVLAATPFLWDRMLGANEVQPPATPQRPFDYENAWAELRSRGLHRHPTVDQQGNPTTTDIIYQGAAGDESFGVFAPSIEYVLVDETHDQLHLVGIFGKPPQADQQVLLAGNPAAIDQWEPRKIICKLPRSGSGSVGDIQVIARNHKSNVRQLSRWTLTGTYKFTEEESAHVVDGNIKLIFRADVGEYRKVPGNVFIRPTRSALAGRDSELLLEAKGTDSTPCGNTGSDKKIWSGSGNFKVRWYADEVPEPFHSIVFLSVNTIDKLGSLGVAFGIFSPDDSPLKVTYEPCDGASVTLPLGPPAPGDFGNPPTFKSPLEELLPDGTAFEIPLPGSTFGLGARFSIPAGEMSNPLRASMKWNDTQIESPPDPNAAR
jgi:hypothetical protein